MFQEKQMANFSQTREENTREAVFLPLPDRQSSGRVEGKPDALSTASGPAAWEVDLGTSSSGRAAPTGGGIQMPARSPY